MTSTDRYYIGTLTVMILVTLLVLHKDIPGSDALAIITYVAGHANGRYSNEQK